MKKHLLLTICLFLVSLSAKPQVDTVIFTVPGGFYEDVIELDIFNYYAQNQIRYTTNGNTPDANSRLYTGSLTLDSSMFSTSNIFTIVNTIPSIFYLPDDVQRAIVIKAAAFDPNGNRLCQPVTNTYFIHSLGCDFHGLPVVSVVADSLDLFDYETGIFVPGINYDPADTTHTGNYYMRGSEWERAVNFEFYETDNQGINQKCGLRAHGGASRYMQQKGMKLYARDEYGKKKFSFPFFGNTSLDKFKRLCLHPFRCSNWLQTGGIDYLSQTIASNLDLETMAVREVVVFINGEYWGIYTMEEAPDERYLESHYNADLEQLSMLKFWGVPYYGDPTEWRAISQWFNTADLSQPEDWAYAIEHIDVSNFVDYVLFETFAANVDWPANNVKSWNLEPGAKFRWIFYDGDGCFNIYAFEAINNALNSGGNSKIFRHFCANEEFLRMFRERYYELRHSYFSYDYMKSILDEYGALVEDEVPRQSQRFNFPRSVEWYYYDMWRAEEFLRQRDSFYMAEIIEHFISLEEIAPAEANLLCFPNPTTDLVSVVGENLRQVEVFDVLGQKLNAQEVNSGHAVFSLQDSPAGLYLVKVTDQEGKQFVRKVVKQ